jgi:hypothetical protein
MEALVVALVSCAIMLSGAYVGSRLRRVLPSHHLEGETKAIVQTGVDLLAVLLCVTMGLLVDSAYASFEAKRAELQRMAADVMVLDRLMEGFGHDGAQVRVMLRRGMAQAAQHIWSADKPAIPDLGATSVSNEVFRAIHQLPGDRPAQQAARTQAVSLAMDIARNRLMLFQALESPLPLVVVGVLVFWLTALFVSFSLFTPLNHTGVGVLVVIAVAASLALLLFLEMRDPFKGLVQIPSHVMSTLLPPLP